jgi:hypothetical protein
VDLCHFIEDHCSVGSNLVEIVSIICLVLPVRASWFKWAPFLLGLVLVFLLSMTHLNSPLWTSTSCSLWRALVVWTCLSQILYIFWHT